MYEKIEHENRMVSIVIPVYNAESYLRICLNSVVSQEYSDLEILCINDASQDGSLDILQDYAEHDTRVKVVDLSRNEGPSKSRNRGLNLAVGKYIYFLDADDYLFPNSISTLKAIADEYGTEVVFFDSTLQKDEKYISPIDNTFQMNSIDRQVMSGVELYKRVSEAGKYFPSSVWRQFWRLDHLKSKNICFPQELASAEDNFFTINALFMTNKAMIVNQVFHTYRRHSGTLSTSNAMWKFVHSFKAYCLFLTLLERYSKGEVSEYLKQRASSVLISCLRLYYMNQENELPKDAFSTYERYLFELLILRRDLLLIENISDEKRELINRAECVVIYGDGKGAVKIAYTLEQMGISILGMGTSKACNDTITVAGKIVRNIKEYISENDGLLIVLGMSKSSRADAINTLHEYGFSNYIELD